MSVKWCGVYGMYNVCVCVKCVSIKLYAMLCKICIKRKEKRVENAHLSSSSVEEKEHSKIIRDRRGPSLDRSSMQIKYKSLTVGSHLSIQSR